jgi:hypothetical protein
MGYRASGVASCTHFSPQKLSKRVRRVAGLCLQLTPEEAAMSRAQVLGVLLLAGQIINPSLAQERGKLPSSAESLPPYPNGSNITFEMNYSCTNSRVCAFNCPGAGGENYAKQLTIYLGTIPIGVNQQSAIFYRFSTSEYSQGNGFSISAGLSVLACQVNGMALDYSGPPQTTPNEPPKDESPPPKKMPSSDEVARGRSGK